MNGMTEFDQERLSRISGLKRGLDSGTEISSKTSLKQAKQRSGVRSSSMLPDDAHRPQHSLVD